MAKLKSGTRIYGTVGVDTSITVGSGVTITSTTVTAINYFTPGNRRVISLSAGVKTLFFEATAPTGWTKLTTHNDKALRVVSGTGGGSGGSTAFSTVMASRTPAGSVAVSNAAFTLTTTEIPSHTHTAYAPNNDVNETASQGYPFGNNHNAFRSSDRTRDYALNSAAISNNGSGGSHTHNNTASFTGTAMDFAVQYVDMILCSVD